MRLGSKLQCVEMKASLRARGIFWTHVHHVWLIAIKDGERAANQKDACVFMVRLRKVMVDGMLDSTFLMNADFALFDDAVVMGIRNRWRTKGQNDRLHSNLFLADEETRETTLSCLQAMCQAVIKQIDTNSADYLPGGVHYDLLLKVSPTEEEKAQISRFLTVSLTSDPMEQVYSHMDYDYRAQFNIKLGTAAGKTAFRANKTMECYEGLRDSQRTCACNLMRRLYVKTNNQVNGQYTDARFVRRRHLKDRVAAAEKKRKSLIRSMLKFESAVIIYTRSAWREWLTEMRGLISGKAARERAHLNKMSEQFNCLKFRCGVRYIWTHTTEDPPQEQVPRRTY